MSGHGPPILKISIMSKNWPWISPTTVTGALMCTTLLSFMRSSFVLAHIASMTDSASSSFFESRDMHSSRSTVAMRSQRPHVCTFAPMRDVQGRPGMVVSMK